LDLTHQAANKSLNHNAVAFTQARHHFVKNASCSKHLEEEAVADDEDQQQ
jgi:hypothetical protein